MDSEAEACRYPLILPSVAPCQSSICLSAACYISIKPGNTQNLAVFDIALATSYSLFKILRSESNYKISICAGAQLL